MEILIVIYLRLKEGCSQVQGLRFKPNFLIVSHFDRFDLLLFVSRRYCDTELRKYSLIIRHDITIGMNLVKIVDKYDIGPCLDLSAVEM